jgi:hypothetical protein
LDQHHNTTQKKLNPFSLLLSFPLLILFNIQSLHFKLLHPILLSNVGSISFVLHPIDSNLLHITITHIHIQPEFQHQGFGSLLLSFCLYFVYHHTQSSTFTQLLFLLDDMSDHFKQPNNLYTHFGFSYIEFGCPEMSLHLDPSSLLQHFHSLPTKQIPFQPTLDPVSPSWNSFLQEKKNKY